MHFLDHGIVYRRRYTYNTSPLGAPGRHPVTDMKDRSIDRSVNQSTTKPTSRLSPENKKKNRQDVQKKHNTLLLKFRRTHGDEARLKNRKKTQGKRRKGKERKSHSAAKSNAGDNTAVTMEGHQIPNVLKQHSQAGVSI